ncbi:hypothetical protein Tco_0886203 [Tanacetum coccineum]
MNQLRGEESGDVLVTGKTSLVDQDDGPRQAYDIQRVLCEYVEVVGFESLVLRAGSAKKVLNHAQFRQQFDFDAKNTRNKMEMEYIAKGWNAMKARMAVQHEITSFANEAIMGWLSSIYDDYFADKECLKEHGGDLIMTGLSVIFMWLGSFLNIDGSLEHVLRELPQREY